MNSPRSGKDCGDHPPITPLKAAQRSTFDPDSWKIYDYVCRHFLGTISKDLKYSEVTTEIVVETETFVNTSKCLIDPGYTSAMNWMAFKNDENAAKFSEGQTVEIHDIKLSEHQTSPPDYLTESDLISLMEKHGIGTDASIPVHINNISQRNYVTIGSGRKLMPTALGIVLVHGYQKIDPELVLPTMRSEVEKMLSLIAAGSADFKNVLKHAVTIFKLKFQYFVQNIQNMDALFDAKFSPLSESGKSFSRCGKCRRYMKYIQTKPSRLYCNHCDETYSLPNGGNIRTYKELKCPLDEFELVAFSNGSKGKSYPLCPYCYNHPPFTDMQKNGGCNSCTHPTCPNALYALGISSCTDCANGVLVLDLTLTPNTWKIGCNSCDVIINIFKDASKITLNPGTLCDCGAQTVTVTYKQEKSKFKDNSEEKSGCVFCCEEFKHLVEKHRAVGAPPSNFNNGGFRGKNGMKGKRSIPKRGKNKNF